MINIIRDLLLFGAKKGLVYLLRDDFTTALVAGSVNGTNAEPGPGLRTVVDAENKLSITGGALLFSGGKATPVTGDPGIWYQSLPRVSGAIFQAEFNCSTLASKILDIGWDTNQSGATSWGITTNGTVDIRVRDSGTAIVVGTGLATNTSYRVTTIMQTFGAQVFLHGGAYINPTLVYVCTTGNTSPCYPAISNNNAVFTDDYVIVPTALWMATPIASDGFASAFGTTDGAGHVDTSPLGAGGSDLTWTQQVGAWTVATGKANASALSGGKALATVPATLTPDLLIAAALTRSAGVVGLVVRYTDTSNYVVAYHDGTNAKLDQVVAGVTTNKISAAATYSASAILRAQVDGQNAQLWYNTTRVGTTSSLDSSLVGTNVGIYTTDTGNTFDNFNVYARGTSNEYSYLNSFFLTSRPQRLFAVGDSKTAGDDWVQLLINSLATATSQNWEEVSPRYGISGYTAAQMKTYIDANLSSVAGTAHRATINLGANDMSSMPVQATFKANYTSIIDSLRAKWSGIKIYCALPWRQGLDSDSNTLCTWILDVIATYPSNVYAGLDERVTIKAGDNGVTNTVDGIHYSAAGETAAAAGWLTAMGY